MLTGFNSTGKTTVIQSLAFVKQSLQKKELSFNDYLLRLGDYREVVSRHDTDLPIRISVTLDGDAEELHYSLAWWSPLPSMARKDGNGIAAPTVPSRPQGACSSR